MAAGKRSKAEIIFPLSFDFKHSEMRTNPSLQNAETDCRAGRDVSPHSQAESSRITSYFSPPPRKRKTPTGTEISSSCISAKSSKLAITFLSEENADDLKSSFKFMLALKTLGSAKNPLRLSTYFITCDQRCTRLLYWSRKNPLNRAELSIYLR